MRNLSINQFYFGIFINIRSEKWLHPIIIYASSFHPRLIILFHLLLTCILTALWRTKTVKTDHEKSGIWNERLHIMEFNVLLRHLLLFSMFLALSISFNLIFGVYGSPLASANCNCNSVKYWLPEKKYKASNGLFYEEIYPLKENLLSGKAQRRFLVSLPKYCKFEEKNNLILRKYNGYPGFHHLHGFSQVISVV